MFLFKKNISLNDAEFKEIEEFVSKTIEKMLTTKEETFNILRPFGMVLICSWEGNYIVSDIFQLSKFSVADKKDIRRQNTPYYTAARSLDHKKEVIVYLDDHECKGLLIKELQAFYHVCDLLKTVDVNVLSAKEYKCVW